jgi:hypothetical protein
LKGRGFTGCGKTLVLTLLWLQPRRKRRKIKINDGFNRLLNNSSFVSGHRVSDAVIL